MQHKPWLCRMAIDYFETIVNRESVVLELGAGGSTFWLSERVKHISSIDNDPEWARHVMNEIAMCNLPRCLIQTSDYNDPNDTDNQVNWIKTFADRTFDIIFIDNNTLLFTNGQKSFPPSDLRVRCAEVCRFKVKPNGWVVIDNYKWDYVAPALQYFERWPRVEVNDGVWNTVFLQNREVGRSW